MKIFVSHRVPAVSGPHHVPGVGMLPGMGIEPVLCKHCALALVDKPFMIRVYFDQHEIHFEHIDCAKKHEGIK